MSAFSNSQIESLMEATTANREQIAASRICVCMSCRESYAAETVTRFMPDGTAFCPHCTIDAVAGDASGLPITDPAFLDAVRERWFKPMARR